MTIKASNQITFTEHKKIVEIKEYYLATSQNEGITIETAGWTTDIQTIDYTNKYLWNYEEVVYSIGSSEISEPVIIGFYGKGDTGKGIANIVNYYQITQNLVAPALPGSSGQSLWSDISIVANLSPTNKYLWNYEAIIYTDGSVTTTDPAIIGVYGDSGENAITFEIYSVDGFIFKDNLQSIELKVAAFEGSEAISDAKYTWSYLDANSGSTGFTASYKNISGHAQVTNPVLTVQLTDPYALFSLKCTMYYKDQIYEDYVILNREVEIYSAAVRFFDGNNVFSKAEPFVVAYVNLYKNNTLLETVPASSYYISDDTTISGTTITTSAPGTDGMYMYFIHLVNGNYALTLGKYSGGAWKVATVTTGYAYSNNFSSSQTNPVLISREQISRSGEIVFDVRALNGAHLTTASATVIDLNDPVVSSTAPSGPIVGQLWVDTSTASNVLKVWDGTQWIGSEHQGGAVYTSQPSKYERGDLWVLASAWNGYGVGTMLRATATSSTFNAAHWEDANKEMAEMKNNIKQYFSFDPSTGLKIGQTNDNFYVTISATEMGFYDKTSGDAKKVVSISKSSAAIQNATFEGDQGTKVNNEATFNKDAVFNDNVNFGRFMWQIEPSNGSLSLSVE